MVIRRACKATTEKGDQCRAAPLLDSDFCFWHDPEHEREAAEARRAGGINRKKEVALRAIFDVEGLGSIEDIRRVLEAALTGELALENSHARSRTLTGIATAAARLLQQGELDERMAAIEAALNLRQKDRKQRDRKWWQR